MKFMISDAFGWDSQDRYELVHALKIVSVT